MAACLLLTTRDARAGDSVLDDARHPLLPEMHLGIDMHQTTLPGTISLCTPIDRNSCPAVRSLGTSDYGGGKVTHGAFDTGIDFLGVGPVRFGLGVFAGFGDGPTGTIGGDPNAPGVGLRSSASWRTLGVYGIIALRLEGNGWAGYVELMPGFAELQSDVTGSYPALRTDSSFGMMSGRVGFTVPISRMFGMGPSIGMGTAFNGNAPITDINAGLRLELRMSQIFDAEEKKPRQVYPVE